MVWSKWHKTLVAAVTCLGLAQGGSAWSQGVPSASAPAGRAERIMTVVENGKPVCCRVMRSWCQANGLQAFHLESLDTGEILTIEEMGPTVAQEGGRRNVPMRIFHWGANRSSPPGAPVPPAESRTHTGRAGLVPKLFAAPDSRRDKTPASLPEASPANGTGITTTSWNQSTPDSSEMTRNMEMAPPRTSTPQPRGLAVALREYFHPRNRRPAAKSGVQAPGPVPCAPASTLAISQPPTSGSGAQPVNQASAVSPSIAPIPAGKSQVNSPSQAAQPCGQVVQAGRGQVAPAAINTQEPFSTALTTSGAPKAIEKNPIKTVAATQSEPVASTSAKEVAEVIPLTAQPEEAQHRGPWQNLWHKMFPSKAPAPVARPGSPTHSGVPVAAGASRQRRDILTAPERLQTQPGTTDQFPQQTSRPQTLPPGAQSVMAANNGLSQGVTYVPVPMVTVPQPFRPPTPPEPRLPPLPPGPVLPNAFYPHQPYTQQPPTASAAGIYLPMSPVAAGQPCLYPPPPGQGQANPTGCCPTGGCNWGFCTSPYCQPGGCPSCPPYIAQVCQAHCQNCNLPTYPNPAMDRPAMDRPAMIASYGSILAQVITILRESPFPAQREWAAGTLATYDWRTQPHVLSALLNAAQHDPAGSVRASCAFSLGKMNANVEQVRTALQALSADADPRVRQEATQALRRFGVEVSKK